MTIMGYVTGWQIHVQLRGWNAIGIEIVISVIR